MRDFQDTFETDKRSCISAFSICMALPLNKVQQTLELVITDGKIHRYKYHIGCIGV